MGAIRALIEVTPNFPEFFRVQNVSSSSKKYINKFVRLLKILDGWSGTFRRSSIIIHPLKRKSVSEKELFLLNISSDNQQAING